MTEVDILIIGVGTAGEYAAGYANQGGRSVAVIERGPVGGECIFHACIPTKTLIHAARARKRLRRVGFFGLATVDPPVDYARVKAHKDAIVAGIGTGRDQRMVSSGIGVFKGEARFVSPHEVSVADEIIKAEKIIIATGSTPSAPPIPGLSETGFLTNIEALDLEKVPERLAIIGGGPVGVEFAQIFAAFGSQVHIYEAFDRVMSGEDEDISQAAAGFFAAEGIGISTSAKIQRVERSGGGKLVVDQDADGSEQATEFSEILVATGRRPGIEGLNLAAAGLEPGRRGITVDASLQTSVPHIWAAGDCTGTFLFTYVAGEQGKTAALNADDGKRMEVSYDVLPRATFCDPEVASVGLTEKQAGDAGFRVKTGRFDYANLTRTIVADETDGFIKVVADAKTGRILGGHIIGAEASTLIHELSTAMAGGMTASQVGDTLHAYPTLSEGVRYACQAAAE
jgi:mercury(II) reductase